MKHHPIAPQATPTQNAMLTAPRLDEEEPQELAEFAGINVDLPTAAELAEQEADDDGIEPYLEVADICRVSPQFSEHTVRAHFQKLGIGENIGGKIFVCKYVLRQRWYSMHLVLAVAALRGRQQKPQRPKPVPPRRKGAPADRASTEGHGG
jgi:hypothetical protein